MTTHTPGPWKMETVHTTSGICHKIGPFPSNGYHETSHACIYADNVYLYERGFSKVGDELEANARLIAAAPEMYDVLTSIENDAEQVPDWLWDRIRDVLRKANGEQP